MKLGGGLNNKHIVLSIYRTTTYILPLRKRCCNTKQQYIYVWLRVNFMNLFRLFSSVTVYWFKSNWGEWYPIYLYSCFVNVYGNIQHIPFPGLQLLVPNYVLLHAWGILQGNLRNKCLKKLSPSRFTRLLANRWLDDNGHCIKVRTSSIMAV